jgi:DUF2075 family protein
LKSSYYSKDLNEFLKDDVKLILGELSENHQFNLEENQKNAWTRQIQILKEQFQNFDSGRILFEYSIPRMGKRVDVIFIYSGFVFVIEFKVGEEEYPRGAIDQCLDYALDLKDFQEKSHDIQLVPILVSTKAPDINNEFEQFPDRIFKPLRCNSKNLKGVIQKICNTFSGEEIDPLEWENSDYKPTPTIIEAAQALYQGHSVKEISRKGSGEINLIKTAEAINEIIEHSKQNKKKSICFVTGVPGAGKTLAGLNLANERHQYEEEEHAVFLSGNGPLVEVLREALARNDVENSEVKITKTSALRKISLFIQNIHHFRDRYFHDERKPFEKVVVFDEAQRAWNFKQTSAFMQKKKKIDDFSMSEPEFLISIMDRHQDWAVIVCLIGGGQEINVGEAGLPEWFSSIKKQKSEWSVFLPNEILDSEYTRGSNMDELLDGLNYKMLDNLHLKMSIRSFRSELVSDFVKAILDCEKDTAKNLLSKMDKFPFVITRDLDKAKQWLRDNARGNQRFGLTASSGASRLKPFGIYVDLKIDARNWFLNYKDDIRSSYYLEYVASEFDIQGLELDWTCVAWDADLRFENDGWSFYNFRGKAWQEIKNEDRILFLLNAYRVLLTRARQGVVIFLPEGDEKDPTRKKSYYDGTYNYLKGIGIKEIQ